MKRLINSYNDIHEYDLYIEIQYINLDPDIIVSSENTVDGVPFSVNGSWDAFLINMEHVFEKNGFEIKETHSSNRENSLSQYYAIFPVDSDKKLCYEILIVLRVSDHPLIRGVDNGESYYERYTQENNYPEEKDFQDWEFEQILINGHTEYSYVKAIRAVKKIVQDWKDVVSE